MTRVDGPVRIAFCIDSFEIGGTEINAVRTAEALDRDRYALTVFHLQDIGPLRSRYEKLGVPLIHVPISRLYSPKTALRGIRLAGLLRDLDVDVVHTHDLYTNIFAVPWARVLTSCQVIASRRWWYEAPRPGLNTVNRCSCRFAHRILANSRGVANLLVSEEHVPRSKIVEISNFLGDRAFRRLDMHAILSQRRAWNIPDDAFVVGIVARLAPVKNHGLLLKAATLLDSRCHLAIVGDGPTREALEACARQNGLQERIHFLGELVGTENLHQYFDVSVLCSHSEGFPNSAIEAMAAGRALVATPVGGVVDVVKDGETGFLVATDRPEQFADAIRTLQRSPELRERIGSAAAAVVRARFHENTVIGNLCNLYDRLARRRRSRSAPIRP
jgi:glycosyltransferase involved in cell wall biosynthesis